MATKEHVGEGAITEQYIDNGKKKVSAVRVSTVRWVELRYALHGMNKDREKQQVGHL